VLSDAGAARIVGAKEHASPDGLRVVAGRRFVPDGSQRLRRPRLPNLVAEAVSKIADIPGHATDASSAPTPRIDDRQALNYMHDVLGDLAE